MTTTPDARRILLLGATGMLGHQLARVLAARHQLTVTLRGDAAILPADLPPMNVIGGVDLLDPEAPTRLVERGPWDVVVCAAGIVKQTLTAERSVEAFVLNAAVPRELARACVRRGIRLIHFSSDCVFTGAASGRRGPRGYRLEDPADARDAYGLSKLLGEPEQPGCLCLRTSLIGPELRGHHGLFDWYLRERAAQVPGFTRALFSGLTTPVAARLVDRLIRQHPDLDGTWHVAAEPVSKFELLSMLHARLPGTPTVVPAEQPYCDRRLDGSHFAQRTGWQAPAWDAMLDELTETPAR